jgi:hypothetical protein
MDFLFFYGTAYGIDIADLPQFPIGKAKLMTLP